MEKQKIRKVEKTVKKKALLVSYNPVGDFTIGRFEGKHVNILSGNHYHNCIGSEKRRVRDAEEELGALVHGLKTKDLDSVDQIIAYVGKCGFDRAVKVIERFVNEGRKVTMVACDCNWSAKQHIASRLGIPLVECSCGGESKMGEIAERIEKTGKVNLRGV